MNISDELRQRIVKEIRFAVDNMKNSTNNSDKMYHFSAVYGVLDRAFNFEYDPELIFAHQVIRQAFDTINGKIALVMQGTAGTTASIPVNLFPRLQDTLGELANIIEKKQKTYILLENIANLGYSATGNGSYLHLKGLLKI